MIKALRIPQDEKPLFYIEDFLKSLDGSRVCAVMPTQRNLRELSFKNFKTIELFTIKDFTAYANVSDGINIPKELRPFYLKKTCEQMPKDDQLVVFKNERSVFFESITEFIKASSGILSFYRELASEMITTQTLSAVGLYTDYQVQIAVLERIWDKYIKDIEDAGYSDEWESYRTPTYREGFINRYDTFVFLIGGYLTRYELSRLKTLSASKDVYVFFNFFGEKNAQYKKYESILETQISEPKPPGNALVPDIKVIECKSMLEQYEMITNTAFKLHNDFGIEFSKMCVVTPDDSVKSYFLRLDSYNLFDISSGEDIDSFEFYQILNILIDIKSFGDDIIPIELIASIFANPSIKENFDTTDILKIINKQINGGKAYLTIDEALRLPFYDSIGFKILSTGNTETFKESADIIKKYLKDIAIILNKKENEVISKALYQLEMIENIFKDIKDLSFSESNEIIKREFAKLKGKTPKGKLSVIGILESRNLDFEVVFIPAMNENIFPPANKKDLFLNTEIRKNLDLPTFIDRENLQKNYLYQIINRSKHAFISYSTNINEKRRSRFVEELLIEMSSRALIYKGEDYPILKGKIDFFKKNDKLIIEKSDEMIELISKNVISASAFNEYLSCPLKYYFSRILRLPQVIEVEHQISGRDIGNAFHHTIKALYDNNIFPDNKEYQERYKYFFYKEFESLDAYKFNNSERFKIDNIATSLSYIVQSEKERKAEGYETIFAEAELKSECEGLSLKGIADRIDKRGNEYDIIDYKFKNLERISKSPDFAKITDVQLFFYAYLLEKSKDITASNLYYFDLKNEFGLVPYYDMSMYEEFKVLLKEKLSEMKSKECAFVQKKSKNCDYCQFNSICYGE